MYTISVRVLSLRSGVIHEFFDRALILPSCPVFMWVRGFECARAVRSFVYVPCFVLKHVVQIPALLSWVSVLCWGSDTRSVCSVSLCECAVLSALFCPLVFCGVARSSCFLSAACIHVMTWAYVIYVTLVVSCPVLPSLVASCLVFPLQGSFCLLLFCFILLLNKKPILCSTESSPHPFTPHPWQKVDQLTTKYCTSYQSGQIKKLENQFDHDFISVYT